MAEVFISYSSIDSEKAHEILARLEGAGISCWLSQRDIPPGADYALEIPKAITACSYFVLLLTNAAQDSPYVMLELDQAFKQKKEIIPIQLEQLAENEKTNFFLNAKQKLDATKNLTSAVNDVVRCVRPNISETIRTGNIHRNAPIHQKAVRCPHCEGEILKLIRCADLGGGLYVEEGVFTRNKNYFWINEESIHDVLSLLTSVAVLAIAVCGLIISILLKNNLHTLAQVKMHLLIIIVIFWCVCIVASLILLRCYYKIWEKDLMQERQLESRLEAFNSATDHLCQSIHNSDLKYWTLKCARCEKEFSILLPAEESINDRVANLLEEIIEIKRISIRDKKEI